jgi:hypothetical protein
MLRLKESIQGVSSLFVPIGNCQESLLRHPILSHVQNHSFSLIINPAGAAGAFALGYELGGLTSDYLLPHIPAASSPNSAYSLF